MSKRNSTFERLEKDPSWEAQIHAHMAYLATLSEEEREDYQTFRLIGFVIRCRALGASWRSVAKFFGGSKSWWGRLAPVLDEAASHLGQDGWRSPGRVKEALSQTGQETWERMQRMQQFRPADSDPLSTGLAALARLLNHDPRELVAAMTPEGRAEVERLAPRVAAWLAEIAS
jgi:hypothetical protein